MDELIINFIKTYGLPLGLIALGGVVLLCILKYGNVFRKLAEKWRHFLYLAITIGFSLIASAIYLAASGQFSAEYFFAVGLAIFTLDQAIYAIIKATPAGDLVSGLFDKIKAAIKKKTSAAAAEPPAVEQKDENGEKTAQNGATTSTDGGDAQTPNK